MTAFGFLFDFVGNANNTVVQRVEDTVNEQWFQDAIRDKDVDIFLVTGHVPIRDSREFNLIFETIRKVKWDTPIQFLGGHTHIRDFVKYDARAFGLESGRYLETIGFASVSGVNSGGKEGMTTNAGKNTFSRRYIDNNLFSFHHHSNTNSSTFPTDHGRNVSDAISSARKSLKLDKPYGCAPQTYWINRAPYPDKDSIFTWLEQSVIPKQIGDYQVSNRSNRSAVVIVNTGALRFDIFEGPFTRDTTYLVSPFTSGLGLIENVPREIAGQILPLLNQGSPPFDFSGLASPIPARLGLEVGLQKRSPEMRANAMYDASRQQVPMDGNEVSYEHDGIKSDLFPGYTTVDDVGNDGDDTEHEPIQFFDVPNCFAANIELTRTLEKSGKDSSDAETVDLVYNEFIEPWILLALQYLGSDYSLDDTQSYMDGKSFTSVMTDWVEEHWKCND